MAALTILQPDRQCRSWCLQALVFGDFAIVLDKEMQGLHLASASIGHVELENEGLYCSCQA